ncbi:hypothetical protein BHE74_00021991 [Ensete ventricosum]|nr:hypothetical protein BHE74_00021991 [Ensete ventricosum]
MQITPDRISLTMQQESWKYGDLRVGYRPRSLFSKRGEVASQAWFGGDVHGPRLRRTKPHTGTDIGFRRVPFVPPGAGELDQLPQAQGLLQQQRGRLSHSQRNLHLPKRQL